MRMMLTDQEYTQILDFKRDLHMHPELSLQEFRTTEKIREALSAIPGVEKNISTRRPNMKQDTIISQRGVLRGV